MQSRKSNIQVLASLRAQIEYWDRWRRLILPCFVALFVALVVLAIQIGKDFTNPTDSLFGYGYPFAMLGLFFGLFLGVAGTVTMSFVVKATVGGFRVERLLLELNSELEQLRSQE